ncbi:MAG: hypothetical protein US74_C0022G0014 [Parcubacteria group bacterium GW2011_GWA2_38_13]|nr:MAG: hypothetical protein US74_C0022G0014 [Parcubacteria group bacterium GW2011_GWA2_38_13]
MNGEHVEAGKIFDGDAIMAIRCIMQECASMGGNDSEIPDLMRLIQKVENGEIEPNEAIFQAEAIKESEMAYH